MSGVEVGLLVVVVTLWCMRGLQGMAESQRLRADQQWHNEQMKVLTEIRDSICDRMPS